MAKPRTIHTCTYCAAQHPRWLGRCTECGRWDTLVEEAVGGDPAPPRSSPDLLARNPPKGAPSRPVPRARVLSEVESVATPRFASGLGELDRVLGGGLVPGSVVLLGGEPGVGKSTLALQLATALPPEVASAVLYVAGEESPEQVRLRADRLPDEASRVHVLAETRVEALAESWSALSPAVVVVDSIQTLRSDGVQGAAGSVAQVKECAAMLSATAKGHGAALILLGHVTKDGTLAGPRVLEHLVDVVLQLEGDRAHAFRLLRATKNRFGSTQEVGVFTMAASGLQGVANPSELFLAERRGGAPGSCVVPLLEGTRPMLIEIQALVAAATYGTPRRTAIGVEDGRVALLLAVLDRRSDVDLLSRDVYVNAVGGVRVGEPAADLALALAIASSRLDIALPSDTAACGEIGLGGEVRRVARLDLRVREAARLGYRRVLVPRDAVAELGPGFAGAELQGVADVREAVAWLRSSSSGHAL